MSDPKFSKPEQPDHWHGIGDLLQKLNKLGWIESADLFHREGEHRMVDIKFTPAGKAGLKPFADFWHKVGGMYEKECLALFFAAIQSQSQEL